MNLMIIYQHNDQEADGAVQATTGVFGKFILRFFLTDGIRKLRNSYCVLVSSGSILRSLRQSMKLNELEQVIHCSNQNEYVFHQDDEYHLVV